MSYEHCAHGMRIVDGVPRCVPCLTKRLEDMEAEASAWRANARDSGEESRRLKARLTEVEMWLAEAIAERDKHKLALTAQERDAAWRCNVPGCDHLARRGRPCETCSAAENALEVERGLPSPSMARDYLRRAADSAPEGRK